MNDKNRIGLLGRNAFAQEGCLGSSDRLWKDAFAQEGCLGSSDRLWKDAFAQEGRLGSSDRLWKDAFAQEALLGSSDRLWKDAFAQEGRLGSSDLLGRNAFAQEALLGSSDRLWKDAFAQKALLGSSDRLWKDAFAQEGRLGSSDLLGRNAFAHMESLMKFEPDWQKQLNLFSAPQASLGFPNIIKNGLLTNPSRISTPEQHRTPLLEPSPTAITPEVYEEISPEIIPAPAPELVPITDHQKVFIVHGHDHESRDAVADFVDNWGLTPTILDKQSNKGRTIIEKFEDCADEASFAIVLLTPDDVGASVKSKTNLKYRARQNVIYEWGYFSGSIGRERVCILYKGNLELPSDTQGVVYVRMDDNGEWKQSIVREMEAVGLLIDVKKV